MNNEFLDDLQARSSTLSPSESKVAAWILANPAEAVSASIQTVAANSDVSEPTVIRLCRRMGLGGYRDLKTHLIAALHKTESYLHHDVGVEDDPTSAAGKVLENSIGALVDLRKQIFTMPFTAAVDVIANARQVIFCGIGASGHVAADARHKFFRLGIPVSAIADLPTILQQSAVCQPGDVFVAISHTGAWREMVEGMSIAVSNGAVVLAVTDPKSPLAEAASILFGCHANEDTNVYTPMSSRLAQLTVLDALQVSVALQVGERAEESLRSAKAALSLGHAIGEEN